MRRRAPSLLFCVCLAHATSVAEARAQAEPTAQPTSASFEAEARVRAPIASTNPEDPTAAGTRLPLRDRAVGLATVDEIVAEAPGARVRSEGGLGGFSGVALRGAGIEHTSVLLGDLPLSSADTGAFDLGLVPVAVLDSVEVYRGAAPVWWSDGAIGGVVRLVPRTAEQSWLGARAGYGSFGRYELATQSSIVRDRGVRPSLFAHVGLAGADDDYAYVDDNQTRFDGSDDVTLRQRNADVRAADGLLHAGLGLAGGRLQLLLLGHARDQGLPGPLAAPTLHVHRHRVRALGALSWTVEDWDHAGSRRYRFQVSASGRHENDRVTDLERELGVARPVASDDDTEHVLGRVAGSIALLPMLEPTLVVSAARDEHRPRDPLAFDRPPRPSGRSTESIAFEPRLHGELGGVRLELRPSVLARFSQASIWVPNTVGALGTRDQRDDAVATYRVAGVVAPWSALAFSASASTGARLPSMLELFGDRAQLEANPSLRVERSRSLDVSAVARGRTGGLSGTLELRGFALFLDDLIAYRRTAQYAARPENLDSGEVLGVELGAHATYGRHLSLAGSGTALHTQNQFGRSLPLRPPLQLFVRPEVALFPTFPERVAFFGEFDHVSFVYLDSANLTLLEAHTRVALGAVLSLWRERVTLSARVRNALDAGATDVLSRPLPGTSVELSLALKEALP